MRYLWQIARWPKTHSLAKPKQYKNHGYELSSFFHFSLFLSRRYFAYFTHSVNIKHVWDMTYAFLPFFRSVDHFFNNNVVRKKNRFSWTLTRNLKKRFLFRHFSNRYSIEITSINIIFNMCCFFFDDSPSSLSGAKAMIRLQSNYNNNE